MLMLFIPMIASLNINRTYNKYKKQENNSKKTGYDVAREILDKNGLESLYIVETQGNLTDCYDSSRRTIKLSSDIYHGTSVAAVSVAAHECGHAIQDKEGYSWMRIRSMIFPVVNIGTTVAYYILIAGLIFQIMDLLYIAVALTGLGLIFQVVTLPVEFDASKRAEKILADEGIITADESVGVHKVLKSAAMTYVAGVLTAIVQILYYISRYIDRN